MFQRTFPILTSHLSGTLRSLYGFIGFLYHIVSGLAGEISVVAFLQKYFTLCRRELAQSRSHHVVERFMFSEYCVKRSDSRGDGGCPCNRTSNRQGNLFFGYSETSSSMRCGHSLNHGKWRETEPG